MIVFCAECSHWLVALHFVKTPILKPRRVFMLTVLGAAYVCAICLCGDGWYAAG